MATHQGIDPCAGRSPPRNGRLPALLAAVSTGLDGGGDSPSGPPAAILNAVGVGVVVVDDSGAVVRANLRACRLLGWPEDEMRGLGAHRLFHHSHADGRPYAWDHCPTCVALGEGRATERRGEVFWRRDGVALPVWYGSVPLRIEGEVVGAVLTFDVDADDSARQGERGFIAREALAAILRRSLAPQPLEQVLEGCLTEVVAFPWLDLVPRASVMLMTEDGSGLRVAAAIGHGPDWPCRYHEIGLDECPCGEAAASGSVVFTDSEGGRRGVGCIASDTAGHYCIPLRVEDRVLGVLSLQVRAGQGREPGIEAFLMMVADTLAGIVVRKQAEALLRHREEVMAAVASVAQTFLHTRDWHDSMPWVLKGLGEAVAADRANLFRLQRSDGGRLLATQAFEWVAEGIESRRGDPALRDVDVAAGGGFDEVMAELRRHRPFKGIVSGFAEPSRRFFENLGVRSLVILPVFAGPDLWGVIGVDSCRSERVWSTVEVEALASVAHSLGFAISRGIEERDREGLLDRLARSNQELEQFAYVASHDLQEPLRMISSYLGLLRRRYEGRLDSEADEFIAFAVGGAQRISRLIRDLLAYSRVGRSDDGMDPVDTASVVEAAVTNLAGAVADAAAEISTGVLPIVTANEAQLVSLFQNLIGNALKYRHPDRAPAIRIDGRRVDGEWEISVTDNGIGIAPEHRERVFMIFQRLHSRAEAEGTGLGLAICKKIVELHGGRIWVDSTPGEGSVFRFTLPAAGPTVG